MTLQEKFEQLLTIDNSVKSLDEKIKNERLQIHGEDLTYEIVTSNRENDLLIEGYQDEIKELKTERTRISNQIIIDLREDNKEQIDINVEGISYNLFLCISGSNRDNPTAISLNYSPRV